LPPGSVKRFLQGIIQVSVGLYHARRGSYHGAVNQLAKGLDKLRGERGAVMGLDCDRFVRDVTAALQRLTTQPARDTRSMPQDEMPRMHLVTR
jgi:predicted metal-dependent hydrolase